MDDSMDDSFDDSFDGSFDGSFDVPVLIPQLLSQWIRFLEPLSALPLFAPPRKLAAEAPLGPWKARLEKRLSAVCWICGEFESPNKRCRLQSIGPWRITCFNERFREVNRFSTLLFN